MDLTAFRASYPEFAEAGDSLVQGHLDEASLSLDSSVYDTRYDEAHGLLAAHLLAISPFGRALRQEGTDETLYWQRFRQVRRERAPRMVVP